MREGRFEFVRGEGVRTFSCSHDVVEIIAAKNLAKVLPEFLYFLITTEHLTFPSVQLHLSIPLLRCHQADDTIQLMHIVLLGILLCLGEEFILLLLPRKTGATMGKLAQSSAPDEVSPCMKHTSNGCNPGTHRLTKMPPSSLFGGFPKKKH